MKEIFVIGGIEMSLPFILGAGVAKHPNHILPFLRHDTPLGAVISGSYTKESREGNKGELAWPADLGELMQNGFALNAYGMPNLGLSTAATLFPEDPGKPHLISIAGFASRDHSEMLAFLKGNTRIAGVELNGGCPNTGHLPVAYVMNDLAQLLECVRSVGFDKPIWLKLSPYMTTCELENFATAHPELNFTNTPTVHEGFINELCVLLSEYSDILSAVVMSNTVPNVMYGNSITVKNADGTTHHKGGLSGPIVRDHNLRLIKKVVATGLANTIDLIGCGGVLSGNDALAYLKAGCTAVACTSGPSWFGNPRFFSDLLEGSEELQEFICSM